MNAVLPQPIDLVGVQRSVELFGKRIHRQRRQNSGARRAGSWLFSQCRVKSAHNPAWQCSLRQQTTENGLDNGRISNSAEQAGLNMRNQNFTDSRLSHSGSSQNARCKWIGVALFVLAASVA